MKVLILHRQGLGGTATYAQALAEALPEHGVEAVLEDATPWMPNQTDMATSKVVSKRLRELGAAYDLIHAVGYRTAWACSDAYSYKEAWLYTAYDMPKTTKRLFIDNLNHAQVGICASHAVRAELADAGALDVMVRYPGTRVGFGSELAKLEAKSAIGVPGDAFLVGAMGRLVPEHGFDALLDSMEMVWGTQPEAQLAIAGQGPDEAALQQRAGNLSKPDHVRFLGRLPSPADFLAAVDLYVVPARRAGFSMGAVEAMSLGVPVLARWIDAIPEILQADYSGLAFETDEELGLRVAESMDMPMMLNSVGNAGRVRVDSMFSMAAHAQAVARSYRTILE